MNARLRDLPSVDELLSRIDTRYPRELLVAEIRRTIDGARERLKSGEPVDLENLDRQVLQQLTQIDQPGLRPVINATGVVLHTNLGRAPLAATQAPSGYSNLEYDLSTGKRGKRDIHVASLLERLTGRPGIVVNNNAAAVYLVLNELAAGGEVIVSRGELIEIGDGFRIPDIMARSGAILREVGTTNRTNIEDYRAAINERTRLILRVHPSNFHITGFTSRPRLDELTTLGIPVYEDLGSGCLIDLKQYGVNEPLVGDSIQAGVNLVSFSGDKLLGGPQAGIIAGDPDLVARIRRNPMFRALRVDKLIYNALETTLRAVLFSRWQELPAIRIIMTPADEIRRRAEALVSRLQIAATVELAQSVIGGGATPDQTIPTYVIAIRTSDAAKLERRLRAGDPPVIARMEDGALLLDLRTVFETQENELASAVAQAFLPVNASSPL